MALPDTLSRISTTQAAVVAILLAAVVGLVVAPGVYDRAHGPDGTVAVVEIEGIITESLADDVEQQLRTARADGDVEAVVLSINSPGGAPAPTERLYLAVQRTAETMPVVASVRSLGASGSYYLMMPSEEIYVLPTSQIGSVGLSASAPAASPPAEGPSGPDKVGQHPTEIWAMHEALATVFIDTVMTHRGDRLELDREEVAHAKIYLGVQAVDNGIADEVGSLDDAVASAARSAGLSSYDVVRPGGGSSEGTSVLLRTDDGFVKLQNGTPDYGDVERPQLLMVYADAVPHVSEVEPFVERTDGGTEA